MKRLLLAVMALTMLMPGMACAAMPCGQMMGTPTPKSADMNMQGMDMSHMDKPCDHCPPQNAPQDSQQAPLHMMLMSDCSHTSLMATDAATVVPALSLQHHDFVMAIHILPPVSLAQATLYTIRGPPDKNAAFSPSYPALFLATQRLRL